ncbi:MAG: hypothetical protein NT062_31255 [Proteobacteria bacterium]|nr:hypothetical protein [Pseudomonadota bacterium]
MVAFKTQVVEPIPPSELVKELRQRDARTRAARAAARAAIAAALEPTTLPTTPAARRARAIEAAQGAGILAADLGGMMAAIMGTADLNEEMKDLGPVHGEHEAEAIGFGGARRFDPTITAAKIGGYHTVATGHGAGDDYDLAGARRPPPIAIALCETAACTAPPVIRDEVRDRRWSLTACYRAANARGAGQVVVDFEVGPGGKPTSVTGRGLGPVGACAATVIGNLEFPQVAEGTRVRYAMAFKPSA